MVREGFEERTSRENGSADASSKYHSRRSSDRRGIDRSRSRDRDRRRHSDTKRYRSHSRSPYHRDSRFRDSYNEYRSRKHEASPERSYKRQRRYSSASRNSRDDYQEPRRRHSRSRSPASRHRRPNNISRRSMSPPARKRSPSHKPHKRSRYPLSLSPSPPPRTHSPPPSKRSSRPLPSQKDAYTSNSTSTALKKQSPPPPSEKQKPNYAPTGLLAAETNTVVNTSIVLKYHEPPDARLPPPSQPHLLYIFKSSSLLQTIPLQERSCWLFGREKMVADVAIEHPSCSKQHAVLQFRYVVKKDEWGEKKGGVRLYVLDLDSANGTWLNGERVEGRRYVEVRHKDVLRWGSSEREYVVLVPGKEGKEGK